jgi:hypothetical protein
MPPIRRVLTFVILLFFVFMLFPSPNALKTLFTSQNTDLYTGIAQTPNTSTLASTKVQTSIPGSELVTGFSLLDRLYLRNGTFFIVTANRSAFPPMRLIIMPGLDIGAGDDMEPTDKVLICSDRVPCQCHKQ